MTRLLVQASIFESRYFQSGRVNSCGCLRKELAAQRHFKDLSGKKFGRLTILQLDKESLKFIKN